MLGLTWFIPSGYKMHQMIKILQEKNVEGHDIVVFVLV